MNYPELQKERSSFNTVYREINKNNFSERVQGASSACTVGQGYPAAKTKKQFS